MSKGHAVVDTAWFERNGLTFLRQCDFRFSERGICEGEAVAKQGFTWLSCHGFEQVAQGLCWSASG